MQIAYINHGRFPTEKAHGNQMAQVCSALTAIGHAVTMVCPSIRNFLTANPLAYYGVSHAFPIVHLPHQDPQTWRVLPEQVSVPLRTMLFKRALRRWIAEHPTDLVYVRSHHLLSALTGQSSTVILELHTLPRIGRGRFVHRILQGRVTIVCLTTAQRDTLLSWGIPSSQLLVEPDGVDLARFAHLPVPSEAKRHWQLPLDRPIIGYAGSLVTNTTLEKGVNILIESLPYLKSRRPSPLVWIVGGPLQWVKRYRTRAEELGCSELVRFEGPVPPADVPLALAAFDLAIYPAPQSDDPYFLRDTSPLKLFEYMAAGTPIVCADLPPVRNVLDERTARFCQPGDPKNLAQAIDDVLTHPEEASARANAAHALAEHYDWQKRMQRIIAAALHTENN